VHDTSKACLDQEPFDEYEGWTLAKQIAVNQGVREALHIATGDGSATHFSRVVHDGMPTDSAERKGHPLQTGCYDYFPLALMAVARWSLLANEKHNPGEPLHWSKEKSNDHADCLARHQLERGKPDPEMEGMSQTVAVAWRALAQLQIELEEALARHKDPVY